MGDAVEVVSGAGEFAGFAGTESEVGGVEVTLESGAGEVFPEFDAQAESYAVAFEDVDAAIDDGLIEAEGGGAIDEEAAGDEAVIEHCDGVAEAGEDIGAGESTGAGADDGDAVSVGGEGWGIGLVVGEGVVVEELFDGVDGDGFSFAADHAQGFALGVGFTELGADFGHGAGGVEEGGGFEEVAFGGEGEPIGDSVG